MIKLKRGVVALALAATALLLASVSARAGVVFDSMGQTRAGTDPFTADSSTRPGQAASFSTGAGLQTLTDVQVYLSLITGFAGNVSARLLTDAGVSGPSLAPFTPLGSIALGTRIVGDQQLFDFASLSVALTANTRYWIALSVSAHPEAVGWDFEASALGTGVAGEFFVTGAAAPQSNIFGADLMKVTTSTTSVPEPGSLALVGLALAGLGVIRRRKA